VGAEQDLAAPPPARTVLCAIDVAWETDTREPNADGVPSLGELGEATLRAADDEARRRGAALAIIHALPLEPGAPMSPASVEQVLLARPALARAIIDGLARAAERLLGRAADEISVLVEAGPADEAILRAAAQVGAELITLGHAGARARRLRLLGSVAASVVERAPCSVLVVRLRAADSRP
jgi:nucleotide-binding universal stress UspA family protein